MEDATNLRECLGLKPGDPIPPEKLRELSRGDSACARMAKNVIGSVIQHGTELAKKG